MSEKIYAWLLRLYPSHFRHRYNDEALQLFRDRVRDERGFFPGLRLWLDLLTDLAISLPREHLQRQLISVSAQRRLHGMPSFRLLGAESPATGALLFGGVLSLVILGAFPVLISHFGNYPRASVLEPQHPADVLSSAFENSAAQANDAEAQQPKPEDAAGVAVRAVDGNSLDAVRHRIIAKAVEYLKRYYIDPEIALKTGEALLAHENSGDDNASANGAAFAQLVTKQMQDVSHDPQLIMIYEAVRTSQRPLGPTRDEIAQYRSEMEGSNCTFEKVEVFAHNIGYLKLNSFPDLSVCRAKAAAAMASLNNVNAIIFDLRDNRGGSANMVALIATYLFDHPTHLNDFYDRGANSTEQSWTLPRVPGNKLSDKPAYVLTSNTTFSAAEGFSYDLKMLKRATLVGERTSGRRHMGMAHRIDDHFMIRIPGVRVINPISKTNWEGTGVEPDVKVKAADALETAVKLAESKLETSQH